MQGYLLLLHCSISMLFVVPTVAKVVIIAIVAIGGPAMHEYLLLLLLLKYSLRLN